MNWPTGWLAERGAAGVETSRAAAHRWLSAWVQKAAKQAEAEVTDAGTHRDPTGVEQRVAHAYSHRAQVVISLRNTQ